MAATGSLYGCARAFGWHGVVRAFRRAFAGKYLSRAQAEIDEIGQFEHG